MRRAVDDDVSLIGALESGDDVQQRRLAAAGWTDNGHKLARANREVDSGDHRQESLRGRKALPDVGEHDLSGHNATGRP